MATRKAFLIEGGQRQGMLISDWILAKNWVVFWSQSVSQACKTMKSKQADLLIVDPGETACLKDNLDSLKEIWGDSAIALMVSGSDQNRFDEALTLPCDFAIKKPFQQEALSEILNVVELTRAPVGVPLKVLAVDDSPTVRKFMVDSGKEGGMQVSVADTVESALPMLSAERYDCVICDIFMPGMGGIKGITAIAKAAPKTAIMSISGGLEGALTREDALKAAEMMGSDYCLPKPFTAAQMKASVRAAITAHKIKSLGDFPPLTHGVRAVHDKMKVA